MESLDTNSMKLSTGTRCNHEDHIRLFSSNPHHFTQCHANTYIIFLHSPGNIIQTSPSKSMLELAEDCDSRGSACQGFNSEGELKSIITTTPVWTRPTNKCQGLYVKDGINVCPTAPGYAFYEGRDFLANNLTPLQDQGGFIDQMVTACDNEGDDCKGFTTYGSLKSAIDSGSDWTPMPLLCYGVYVRDDISVDCGDVQGYEYHANLDSFGDDIRRIDGASVNELAAACSADPTCEGMS